jgi:glycine cleavage system regulatory protein
MPDPSSPLSVSTVFISSRMEEVAIERRAAFNAAYESGLVPLLFETEPGRVGLKVKLDQLVDRADLFVGIYYRTFGVRYEEELFGMTPIEYEFLRFLEVWKARYLYDRLLHEGCTWRFGGAESKVADRTLEGLRDPKIRREHLHQIWRVANIEEDHWPHFKDAPDYMREPDLGVYRYILRTRVCAFTRGDGEDSSISSDLSTFLPSRMHFCHCRFRARSVPRRGHVTEELPAVGRGVPVPPMPAERFTEPHVDLYHGLKERLGRAVSARVLEVTPPGQGSCVTLKIESDDREGLLEEILEVLFTASLNISLLVLDSVNNKARSVLTVHRSDERLTAEAALRDLQVNLDVQVRGYLREANPRPEGGREPEFSINVLDPATLLDEAKAELGEGPAFEADPHQGVEGDTFSLQVSGADVPGIFLSLARVIADSKANILKGEFTSGQRSGIAHDARGWFRRNYFTGEVVIRMNSIDPKKTENQLLELRYKLLNLLGVQDIGIKQMRERTQDARSEHGTDRLT